MITPDDIKARFDQFASVSTEKIQFAIDEAVLEVDEANWGDLYDTGLLWLSAHLLTVDPSLGGDGGANSGLVTKTTIGRTTVEFAGGSSAGAGTVSDGPHNASYYGRRYDYYVYNYIGKEVIVV